MQFLIQTKDMERHLGLGSLDPFKVHLPVFVEVPVSLMHCLLLLLFLSWTLKDVFISSIFPKIEEENLLLPLSLTLLMLSLSLSLTLSLSQINIIFFKKIWQNRYTMGTLTMGY